LEEGLKKRLLGAAVLAALAVIFVPMLVEEPVDKAELVMTPPPPKAKPFESQLLREEVPPPVPVIPPTQAVAPEPMPEPMPEKAPAEEPEPAQAETETAADTPGLRTGLSAWVVQVGSFSSAENAGKLVEKLRAAGFQTQDPEQIEIRGKVLYRVRVGPVLEKDRAAAMLPKVDKVSGTKGSVRSYP
jgi:DedD protein